MRLTKTLIAAALASVVAGTSMAGGLAPAAPDNIVIIPDAPAQRSSWGIILPILGVALLIGLAAGSDSEDEE